MRGLRVGFKRDLINSSLVSEKMEQEKCKLGDVQKLVQLVFVESVQSLVYHCLQICLILGIFLENDCFDVVFQFETSVIRESDFDKLSDNFSVICSFHVYSAFELLKVSYPIEILDKVLFKTSENCFENNIRSAPKDSQFPVELFNTRV